MSVIVNNTALSNLASVNSLELLKGVFERVYLTPEVYREVENGVHLGRRYLEYIKLTVGVQDWLLMTDLERREIELYNSLKKKVDIGEASCLAIAIVRKWLFITDDRRARRIAERNNIKLSGTLGVLKLAVSQNLISKYEGNILLRTMIQNGYYSPVSELDDIF
jgi:predicted nucleic acid-binding protein